MIASPSIAFNDFSGSANDVTARQSKGRTVLTVKPRPTGAPSPSQIVSRNTLSRISRAYKQLSDSQQHAWEILAEDLRSKAEVKGEAPDLGLGRFSIAGRRWVFGNARRQIKIKLYECNVTVIRRIIDADYRITYNSFTSDTLSATSLYDADNTGRNPSGC